MKLSSTRVTVPIERDGVSTGEIRFDPQDIRFAEGFYELLDGLAKREQQAQSAAEPREQLRVMAELGNWLGERVEAIFGEGSCEVIFGGACSLELYRQFFEGIEPFVSKGRAKRKAKYRATDNSVMV